MIAYTIGSERSYDVALADAALMFEWVTKLGRGYHAGWKGGREEYPGGIIFLAPEEASAAAAAHSESTGYAFAVYEVELESWDDVYEHSEYGFCLRTTRPIARKWKAA